MSSILVTGCAGFIGSNFTKIFKQKYPKKSIIGLDDFSTGKRELLTAGITFYEGSILNSELVDSIFKKHKPDFVFHFAALPSVFYSVENPFHTSNVNTLGTINLLEKAAKYKTKRFIFSSSAAVYGNVKKLPVFEKTTKTNPLSPYALQKYTSEQYCQLFSQSFNLDTVCLRYFNVFGPGQFGDSAYSTVISAWLEALYFPKNKKAFIEGNGTQTRDFCYVTDIVNANFLAMSAKNNFRGETINIASGKKQPLIDIRNLIEKHTKQKLSLEKRPNRIGDIKHSLADVKKAKKLLHYTPKVELEKGIKETIKWFQQRIADIK